MRAVRAKDHTAHHHAIIAMASGVLADVSARRHRTLEVGVELLRRQSARVSSGFVDLITNPADLQHTCTHAISRGEHLAPPLLDHRRIIMLRCPRRVVAL